MSPQIHVISASADRFGSYGWVDRQKVYSETHDFLCLIHLYSLKTVGMRKWWSLSIPWKSRSQPDSTSFVITSGKEQRKPLTLWLQSSQVCSRYKELLILLQVSVGGKDNDVTLKPLSLLPQSHFFFGCLQFCYIMMGPDMSSVSWVWHPHLHSAGDSCPSSVPIPAA